MCLCEGDDSDYHVKRIDIVGRFFTVRLDPLYLYSRNYNYYNTSQGETPIQHHLD
jgi:hypothetical protein